MDSTNKKCPMCAEEIRLEAQLCRYCGAAFKISAHGYCPSCRQVRQADGKNRCIHCGSDLVDIQIMSEHIEQDVPENSAPAPLRAPLAQVPRSSNKKPSSSKWVLFVVLFLVLVGSCLGIGILAMPKINALLATDTPRPTRTQTPTRTITATPTPRPTFTSTPTPVEITFDTIGNYPNGTRVTMTGVLVLFSSTKCQYECGLLLAEYTDSPKKITIFVRVAEAGVEPLPNQMKALPETYGQWDIRVRLNDGEYAFVGQRIRVTGRITETTSGNPAISDILLIELPR